MRLVEGRHILKQLCWSVALAGAFLVAVPSHAQAVGPDIATVETADEALRRDAAEYAIRYALPVDEAVRDLRAEQASVPATDAIAREFADRLIGVTVDHRPRLRITVVLAGAASVAPRTIASAGIAIPVVFRTGSTATQSDLVAAITRYQTTIRRDLRQPPAIGIDERTGELLILVSDADASATPLAELRERYARLTGVPVRVEVAGAPITANMLVPGGARMLGTIGGDPQLYLCTAGFAVTDGMRTGIVTAAHCPDELSVVGSDRRRIALPYVLQHGWGYQDVQVNASPEPLPPTFYSDSARAHVREVTGQQSRASTRVGDFVCHRGERTGYSCSEVLMTDFAPAGDLCGGDCLATWVAVDGPRCQGGDSGAPVFSGATALGIVKGGTYRADGTCTMYFYMSLDYLPTGWSLLTTTGQTPAATPP